ncbi:MAG: hypothetical protein DRQ78_02540 [Epsilonproteobacteria bacterium]|nr:MAG: hypothetical protein DRQ78_02540 [Campylobacterota bacterium]
MLYYYANTGHKIGLERLRRGVALLNSLADKGIQTCFLVNDFRAGLVAKDLGVQDYVTVEGVQDIDAIAEHGDSIIIDSIEDDHGRLVKYCEDFKNVWRFAHDTEDTAIHDEKVLNSDVVLVDARYFEKVKKEERVLFFLGDADYDKIVLGNADFFKAFNMDILLGNYFFVKYEDDLAKLFVTLHEPEEYSELIKISSTVVTTSAQAALEAKASDARVIFLQIKELKSLYEEVYLNKNGIEIVDGFNVEELKVILDKSPQNTDNKLKIYDDKSIIKEL